MPNRRTHDHLVAFNFAIEIEGITQGPVTYIGGLGACTDVLDVKDGNTVVRRQRPGQTHYNSLTVRRGFTNTDELFDWYARTRAGTVERKSLSVILFGDDASSEIARFNFFEAWPCRWELLPLSSDDSGVLEEEIEIVVELMERA
ncbi:MAG: phage tail protein [Gammaproteobacteria bacterium]|nr:phage tail protein [Gammaproteobacteria bacterium]